MLSARGDRVRSLIRNPDHADDVREAGGDPVVCDLEAADDQTVVPRRSERRRRGRVRGAPGGPGQRLRAQGDDGPRRRRQADRRGQGREISRYVIVSSRGADPEAPGDDTFSVYLRAKGQADAELAASGLDYTIVRPAGSPTTPGPVACEPTPGDGSIPREDVAAVLAAVLSEPGTIGPTFELGLRRHADRRGGRASRWAPSIAGFRRRRGTGVRAAEASRPPARPDQTVPPTACATSRFPPASARALRAARARPRRRDRARPRAGHARRRAARARSGRRGVRRAGRAPLLRGDRRRAARLRLRRVRRRSPPHAPDLGCCGSALGE